MTTLRIVRNLAVALLGTATLAGCYVGATRPSGYYNTRPSSQVYVRGQVAVGDPGYVYPSTAAPDPIYEDVPPAPYYGHVWIDGYWNWNGYEWQWMPGHWEAPRQDYVYVQPYYDYSGPSYVYVPGYWEHRNRLPGYIRIEDSRDGRPYRGYYHSTPNYRVPSRASNRGDGGAYPQPQQPGRVVIPSRSGNSGGGYHQPQQPGRVVIPSQTGGDYQQPIPQNPQPNNPGRVVIPSQTGNGGGYGGPPPQPPGRVVIPSNPGGGGPPQGPPPGNPGRVVIPSNPGGGGGPPPGPPPSNPGRVVIPANPSGGGGGPPPAAPPNNPGNQGNSRHGGPRRDSTTPAGEPYTDQQREDQRQTQQQQQQDQPRKPPRVIIKSK